MNLIIKKVCFLVGLTLCVVAESCCQVVTSTRNGLWTDPLVWDSGQVPTLENATETIINHEIVIPGAIAVSIRNVVLNGRLTVEQGTVVDLVADALLDKKDLQVLGVLVLSDGAVLNGTSISNTSFESGARYIHLQGPLGFIPYAVWDANSTIEIAGFKTQGYINIAHSESWKQNFGHVVYNCSQQTTAFVDLNGYLRNIAGNLVVQSTNNQTLRLSTTQNPTISIGGSLIIEGPSKVWFSTTPSNAVINIQNDFRYRSTSSGISYLTTKGTVAVNVDGSMEINSPGRIHMASTSADSVGTRQATINLGENLNITAGVIVAPPIPGKGIIRFSGGDVQAVSASSTGSSFQGNIDYIVENTSTVNLGTAALSNASGTLLVKGKLQVGSTDPLGAIQLVNRGNLFIQGQRTYESGASIEYNGTAEQFIGDGHPDAPEVNLICSNPVGVTLLKNIDVNDFNVDGAVATQTFSIAVQGDLQVMPGVEFIPHRIRMIGDQEQLISASGSAFENLVINKPANAVNLTSPLNISRSLLIESSNTAVRSNGFLTLLSTSDDALGTACVGPLPSGSSIAGDVTVMRHMAAEGRIYRFLGSPIQNATVASWKDDFPITGKFLDPSTGAGIRPSSPSLYFYDESIGGLQEGWQPYPTSGLASNNALEPGKGYAAFIRNATTSTTWDVTGILNQGAIEMPVAFTPNDQPSNGWNLVGNPYACAIQWQESALDGWTMENISSVIAVYDNEVSGIYRYWDMDENYAEIPDGRIAPGQSFWVKAIASNPQLIIREGVKVQDGAPFFRKQTQRIPSLEIRLSKDSITDITYLKIRPPAKPELDNWDGEKLDNDNFDIAFVSSEGKSLAIQATNQMPCDTVFQMLLKDLTPGLYQIQLTAKHELVRYNYTLLDKFLNTETPLIPGEPLSLRVTEDPASFVPDRISLHLSERTPEARLAVSGPASSCSNQLVPINLAHAEEGVMYSIWDENSRILASELASSNGALAVFVSTDSLPSGNHILTVKAQGACQAVELVENHRLNIDVSPTVHADSAVVCSGNVARLHASSNRADVVFNWFSDDVATDSIATGSGYETPPLYTSRCYFVESVSSSGCASARYSVKVNVTQVFPAKISVVGDTILSSNYHANNSWFLNGEKIGSEEDRHLPLLNAGTYTLLVDTLDCTTTDTLEYAVMRNLPERMEPVVYPNPVVDDLLFVSTDKNSIKHIEIFDGHGRLVLDRRVEDHRENFLLNISSLAAGIYTARIEFDSHIKVVRMVKQTKRN